MKIVVDSDIPFIRGRIKGDGIETVYTDQWGFTPETVRDADALVIRTRTPINESLLKDSSVRLVATATIGMDQIDLPWCATRGITVRNSPGCNAPGVAQYVWSSLLRTGFDSGKDTLGIIGCGNVGSTVKEWGEKLGAKMLISDPPKGMDIPLERLLAESDAVTLHTPLTREGQHATHHLIGQRELSFMRDGTLIINAARGPVVDFAALKPEVTSGRLRAVIDTWEGEPSVDSELLDKVEYGTFHIAGYSFEGKQRATRMVLEALREELGIETDTSGLTGAYTGTDSLHPSEIMESYDPGVETALLRKNPEKFDILRAQYDYRHEVGKL